MYTDRDDVKAIEAELGTPVETGMVFEISPSEFDMVSSSMRNGRAHDTTMFIRAASEPRAVVVIRKPFFPSGVYRAPSGAAHRGETLKQGATRESKEETGLDVALRRYLARINAKFTCGERHIDWTSHVFEAREVSGVLRPIDTHEIAEARWASFEELQGDIRQALLDTGWGLFRYRVALTDLTVGELGEWPA